ncbi:hypothetical protein OC845_006062 [Tilletia horrida]|nr:hypothetical protein OC845_006062 [Tilletia horrida]
MAPSSPFVTAPGASRSGTATSQVLTMPEILRLVLSWLLPDRNDLVACTLVSKAFRAEAQDLLCRHLTIPMGLPMNDFVPTYIRKRGFAGAPVWTLRLFDEDIKNCYAQTGSAGLWRFTYTWHIHHFNAFVPRGSLDNAVHNYEDNRWDSGKTILDAVMLFSNRRPDVELSIGIISSQQLGKSLSRIPEAVKCISSLHIECDFVRVTGANGDLTPQGLAVMRDANRFFPDWVKAAAELVQLICGTQHTAKHKVFKDFRITTGAGSDGPNTPPARLEDVRDMMNSLNDFVEELRLQFNPAQFEAETVDHIFSRSFPQLRRFSFRLPPNPRHVPTSDTITNFLARHSKLEHIDIWVEGVAPQLGALTLPKLRSLSLYQVGLQQLDSFLAVHPHVVKLKVQKPRVPGEDDLQDEDAITALDYLKDVTVDIRLLKKLLAKSQSIKMATPIDISTLADLILCPEQPIEKRVPLAGLTYLDVEVKEEPWLQVLGQLATAFDYRTFPHLSELRLGLNLGGSPAETAIKATSRGANECLHAVIVSLATANHLRVLHLSLRGASELSLARGDEQLLTTYPLALEYLTWWVDVKGYTQSYRVLRETWRGGHWTRAYLKPTSHDHLPATRKTWSPFESAPRLDHYGGHSAQPTMIL